MVLVMVEGEGEWNVFEIGLKRSDLSLVGRNVSLTCLFASRHKKKNENLTLKCYKDGDRYFFNTKKNKVADVGETVRPDSDWKL